MAKKSKKKEDETKKVVAKCDDSDEVVANCDRLTVYSQFESANCDRKNINIENLIHTIRGQRVMFDFDLAMLYGVETRALNQAVKRNLRRFPDDFMFQITKEEWHALRSQIVTLEDLKSQNVISNSVDEETNKRLTSQILDKRADNVGATIHSRYHESFLTDLQKHNEQYREIHFVQLPLKNHDRFLIIDNDMPS